MERVAIVGAGSWGTAAAAMLATDEEPVWLCPRRPEHAEAIRREGQNRAHLPGVSLPVGLKATVDLAAAVPNVALVAMAVPSIGFRSVFAEVVPHLHPDAVVVSLTKGLEPDTRLRMSEVIEQESPGRRVVVLTGPNLVSEIVSGLPSASVAAAADVDCARRVQALFSSERFRVYTNADVAGCELAGAMKNVVAIAIGVADGMSLGVNARAALITRGLAEMTRLGTALGGAESTFAGLAGAGDLIATCSSPASRNRTFGENLAGGRAVTEIESATASVAEGVRTSAEVAALARHVGVSMPICETVAAMIAGETDAIDAVRDLMSRRLRDEA